MSTLRRLASLGAGALLLAACAAQPPDYEVHDIQHQFTRPVGAELYQLSPDGRRLATLTANGEALNLEVTDLETGETYLATRFETWGISGYTWLSSERLGYTVDRDYELYSVRYDGTFKRPSIGIQQVIHVENGTSLRALDGRWDGYADVYRVDDFNKPINMINAGPARTFPRQWLVTALGDIEAAVDEQDGEQVVYRYDAASDSWSEVWRQPLDDSPIRFVQAPVRDGKALVTAHPDFETTEGGLALYEFDLDRGRLGDMALFVDGRDCCELLTEPGTGRPLQATSYSQAGVDVLFLDPDLEATAARLAEDIGARAVRFLQLDEQQRQAVALVDRGLGPRHALVDLRSGQVTLLPVRSKEQTDMAQRRQASHSQIALIEGYRWWRGVPEKGGRSLKFDMVRAGSPLPEYQGSFRDAPPTPPWPKTGAGN